MLQLNSCPDSRTYIDRHASNTKGMIWLVSCPAPRCVLSVVCRYRTLGGRNEQHKPYKENTQPSNQPNKPVHISLNDTLAFSCCPNSPFKQNGFPNHTNSPSAAYVATLLVAILLWTSPFLPKCQVISYIHLFISPIAHAITTKTDLTDLKSEMQANLTRPTILELLQSIAPMLEILPGHLAQESLASIRDKLDSLLRARKLKVDSLMAKNQLQEAETIRVDNIKLAEVCQRLKTDV